MPLQPSQRLETTELTKCATCHRPTRCQAWCSSTVTSFFEGVTPETWDFTVGGYHPAEKWLKDRRRRTLSYEDITHYRRICAILAETPRVHDPHRRSNRPPWGLAAGLIKDIQPRMADPQVHNSSRCSSA